MSESFGEGQRRLNIWSQVGVARLLAGRLKLKSPMISPYQNLYTPATRIHDKTGTEQRSCCLNVLSRGRDPSRGRSGGRGGGTCGLTDHISRYL